MPGFDVSSLSARQQQLVKNVRVALERGQVDYVLDVTGEILGAAPGCAAVRRLQRVARLREFRLQGRWVRRIKSRVGLMPWLSSTRRTPAQRISAAERLLALDPTNVIALKLFAGAALELGWPETAAFAREAVQELRPGDHANLIALGQAWLGAGRPDEALRLAQDVLRVRPVDGPAQELMRAAAIAQTVARGNWESAGTFREKLRR